MQDHDAAQSGADGSNRNPPGSALSLTREVHYDPLSQKLLVSPMPELTLLRNGSLFSARSLDLHPGKIVPLPLGTAGGDAGDAMDFGASFVLGSNGIAFGVSV